MRLPPPDVMATWPTPNYVNPITRGPALVIIELIALAVSTLSLVLRLYTRMYVVRNKTGWDDWIMVAAAIFGAGVTTCVVLAVTRYGWDIHIWDLTFERLIVGRKISFAAQALFILATALAKMSILISYLRIAPLDTWFRRGSIISVWFVGLVNIAFFVALFTQCTPLSSYWDLVTFDRDCIPEAPALLAQASFTALSDFVVWVLPLPTFYRAKLPRSQRLALILLFSFGLVVVISACVRAYWIHYVVQETYDVTWDGFDMWLWTAIEVQLGILCGCVPWLRSLFKNWGGRRKGSASEGSRGGGMHRTQSGRQGTLSFKGASVVRIDSMGKSSSSGGDRPGREQYIDLERCGSNGSTAGRMTFADALYGDQHLRFSDSQMSLADPETGLPAVKLKGARDGKGR